MKDSARRARRIKELGKAISALDWLIPDVSHSTLDDAHRTTRRADYNSLREELEFRLKRENQAKKESKPDGKDS